MQIRVYEYGCGRGQIDGLDLAIEQMRRRIEFWNSMVEIDNDVREKMEALLFAGPDEAELQSLRELLKNLLRNGTGDQSDENSTTKHREQVRALQSATRAKLASVKQTRKDNAAKHRTQLRELDNERKARIAEVQARAGLYWANRDEIRRRYEFARPKAMREGRQLRPQVWNEEGRICIQFPRGLLVPSAFQRNGRLQIDAIPEKAWDSQSRSERRRLARTRLRLRVAANRDRSPIWLDIPVVLHRRMPKDGVIRSVSFIRERVGLNWRHRVLFTVAEPAPPNLAPSERAVGLDLGWRLTPYGLRVVYWADDSGARGELVLPLSDLIEFKRIGNLGGAIVNAHTRTVSSIGSFLRRHTIPVELKQLAKEAVRSSSPQTLVVLFERWRQCRFSGDRYPFTVLRRWYRQYIHLWTWQANLRDQLLRRRRELYRRFAVDLSCHYGRIFVNDIQLNRKVLRPASVEALIPIQRYHRFIAAISVLCRILQSACEKRGVVLKRLRCKGATTSCHVCGMVDDWNPRTTTTHTCSKCGQSWDQDYNAARQVLIQGLALQ